MTNQEIIAKTLNPEYAAKGHGIAPMAEAAKKIPEELLQEIVDHMTPLEPSTLLTFIQEWTDAANKSNETKMALQAINQALVKSQGFLDALKKLHEWKKTQETTTPA